jgi:hypothetical protein
MEEKSKKINPNLTIGDRIILLRTMDDTDPIFASERGEVTGITDLGGGMKNINIKWDNGRNLSILPEIDTWMLENDFGKKKIDEQKENDHYKFTEDFIYFSKFLKYLTIKRFLDKLKESGIVNMFGASPYLYMGKDRIESMHKYDPIAEDNEKYDEMLSLANNCQSELVRATVRILENEGVDGDINTINRALQKNAQKLLLIWMKMHNL